MKMMRNDPIVEEMRAYGQAFVAEHGNEIRRTCQALGELETVSGRKVVHRKPKRLERKAASQLGASTDDATRRH